ncbi:MAG: GAF domain-containing protein [Chloroflexota bacterium]
MSSSLSDHTNAVLECIRHELSYETVAQRFGVSREEVRRWEADFIAAGASALEGNISQAVIDSMSDADSDKLSQIKALNTLSQSFNTQLTVDELIDTLLQNIKSVLGYLPSAGLIEGEDIVLKGGYAISGEKIDWYGWRLPVNTERSVMGWVALNEQSLNISDTTQDSRYIFREVVGDVRSELAIPILSKNVVLGVLDLKSGDLNAFDQNDVDLLETVAFQAAIAIENIRLTETVRRRVGQAELMQRIITSAIQDPNVQAILTSAVQLTHNIMNASGVAIGLASDDGQLLNLTTVAGKGAPILESGQLSIDDSTVIGSAVRMGQVILANEVKRDERFTLNPLFAASQSEVVVPMRSRDSVIGAINVESDQPNAFDETDVAMLTLLADQLTVAIQGAELFDGMQEVNARFLAVLEATDDGIIVWDYDWRVLFGNAAASRLLNFPIQELVGRSLKKNTLPEILIRIASGSQDDRIELPGTPRRIGRCRNLRWESDRASGFLSIIHDITSEVELEETREEMTLLLIHDLKAPLTGIVGGIDMVQDLLTENVPEETIHTILNIAARSGNVLMSMIDTLLDITKFEAGEMILNLDRLQADVLFSDVVNILASAAQAAKITVSTSIDDNLPIIMADSNMIRRALQNLLDNAIKFTPDNGQIHLSAHRHDAKTIRFEVADTGPGVPEAFRQRIFEKYGQVPKQAGRRRGTGLGLAFCRLVAEAHRGRLWLESRPGGGSIFAFTIAQVESQ